MKTELKGKRVELIHCSDPYTRLRPGSKGTVDFVDDLGTVFVSWDSGASLGLVPGEDRFRYIEEGRDRADSTTQVGRAMVDATRNEREGEQ